METHKLSKRIKAILMDEGNDIYYSPISLWEISIKYGLKKLSLNGGSPDDFFAELNDSYYFCKRIEAGDLVSNYKLSAHHKDPFDRFLIWEAIKNNFVLISKDDKMKLYRKDGLKVIF
jgi:PIN domain nuclease of toxin-antitoxin system